MCSNDHFICITDADVFNSAFYHILFDDLEKQPKRVCKFTQPRSEALFLTRTQGLFFIVKWIQLVLFHLSSEWWNDLSSDDRSRTSVSQRETCDASVLPVFIVLLFDLVLQQPADRRASALHAGLHLLSVLWFSLPLSLLLLSLCHFSSSFITLHHYSLIPSLALRAPFAQSNQLVVNGWSISASFLFSFGYSEEMSGDKSRSPPPTLSHPPSPPPSVVALVGEVFGSLSGVQHGPWAEGGIEETGTLVNYCKSPASKLSSFSQRTISSVNHLHLLCLVG